MKDTEGVFMHHLILGIFCSFVLFFSWIASSIFSLYSNIHLLCKACSQKEAVGVLALSGSVCSFAFLNPKEPISQAVADIKVYNR